MSHILSEEQKREWTESEAIRRAQDGDAGAFEYLYRSQSRRVYSLCLRFVKNTADAEDLTQQVFLQLFRKIDTFRGESRISTWLHRITVNLALMRFRRKRPIEVPIQDLEPGATNDDAPREFGADDASLLGAVDRLNLRRAIHKLPPNFRALLLLHDVIGYNHMEIAGMLRCSTTSSRSQLHRARRRLRSLVLGQTNLEHDGAFAQERISRTPKLGRNGGNAPRLELFAPIMSK